MSLSVKKLTPAVDKLISKGRSKVINMKLANREKQILSRIKIEDNLTSGTSKAIEQNADLIGRYARRHKVHLYFSSGETNISSKTKMSVFKNQYISKEFVRNDGKIYFRPVIDKYKLADFPIDDNLKDKSLTDNIKTSIKAAINLYKNNPGKAKFIGEVRRFFCI